MKRLKWCYRADRHPGTNLIKCRVNKYEKWIMIDFLVASANPLKNAYLGMIPAKNGRRKA